MTAEQDVSADDLKVFLEEAESLIDLLDEDFIRLEQEADSEDLIQEIFRAAHTLKGSSGMLGYTAMTGLTHQMEDLLDRVRKGALPVTPELVDALLMSLDGLKVMRDQLRAGTEIDLDIAPLVAELEAAVAGGEAAVEAAPAAGLGLAELLNEAGIAERLQAAATSQTERALRVAVELDPQSEWTAVRCFQLLNELAARGDLLASVPTQQEVEQERAGHHLEAVLVVEGEPDGIGPALETVADVIAVTVEPWDQRRAEADAPSDEERRAIDLGPEARGKSQQEMLEMASQKIETMQTVRIDVERLDQLMNLVGELVIDRTRISQLSRTLNSTYKEDEQVRVLSETATHVEKVVDELHESMMQVRMLPVGLLFSKFPRLVRDLARTTGKQVKLEIEGEGTEIDRSVIEKLKDPLVHMIRNAVDHGIEPSEERAGLGKTEIAVVRLTAAHEQGHILITLRDDGRGIDAAGIRAAAVEKGVVTAEAAERMSDREAVNLIFQPGFSTAQQTTEVSGRGVGMDVVRRDLAAVNGRVEIDTVLGQGTTFSVRLPLTLTTFGGLLVESGGQLYAIPLTSVQETVKPEVQHLETVMRRPVMRLRDSVMPLVRLCEAVGHDVAPRAGQTAGGDEELFAVVVRTGDGENDRPVAVAVDALVDQQEIVVKALSGYMGDTAGVAGASILGDGRVLLIVDVPTLIRGALQSGADAGREERRVAWAA